MTGHELGVCPLLVVQHRECNARKECRSYTIGKRVEGWMLTKEIRQIGVRVQTGESVETNRDGDSVRITPEQLKAQLVQ
eukprot:1183508-Rhodomonas_salina.1